MAKGRVARWMVAGAIAAAASSAWAQIRVLPGRFVVQPPQEGAADDSGGVYVKDSAIAADKFELAKRMEKLKEWHKSADVYQEMIEKYKDRVIPTVFNDKQQPVGYASVTVAVQQQISKWPEDGLTVYRTRFEPAAATLLEGAKKDDFATLHKILDEYFATDSAKQAGIRLMELYLDEGDFAAAGWIGDRLLDWHPNLLVERPAVLFRTAVAYHLGGNEAQAKRRYDELKSKSPDAIGRIAGRDVKLLEELDKEFGQPAPTARGSGADSWRRSIGGSDGNDEISAAQTTIGAPIYKIQFPPPANVPRQAEADVKTQWDNAQKIGKSINIFPVVDRGELFFQDGQRVWALHVESSMPLAGWQQTYPQANGVYLLPGPVFGLMQNDASALLKPRQNTLIVTDDSVLAVMGYPDPRTLMGMGGGAEVGTRLVCLDRATGRQKWTASPSAIPRNETNARALNFSGQPLVVGENAYVLMRGANGAGVEDCSVVCYDLSTGRYRWDCYIASAQNGFGNPLGGGGPVSPSDDTLSHLAFASGRVFVCTNLGAVAAVDAYSGATAWLSIYDRDESTRPRGMGGAFGGGWNGLPVTSESKIKSWQPNPVVVSDGKVFVLPTDGKEILIYDAGTGQEFKRFSREIDTSPESGCNATMILGVIDNKLFLAGGSRSSGDVQSPSSNGDANSALTCVDWRRAKPRSGRVDADSILWFLTLPPLNGRPFLAAKRLYVPLEDKLGLIDISDMATARWFASYPISKTSNAANFPAAEGPGNILVTNDNVIVANATHLVVYADIERIRQKFANLIQADPGNPEPRLILSELLFNAGQVEESLKTLDGAVTTMGGLKNLSAGPNRDRVFSDAINFAKRLGEQEKYALADGLFDRAAAAISNPSQAVTYRLLRAKFIEDGAKVSGRPGWSAAVKLYQEVLSDPKMRQVARAVENGGGLTQAGKEAENAIARLIRQQGPGIYLDLENQAQAKLEALKAKPDADALLALAETYPNSSVASTAMQLAADVYEKTSPRLAIQVLRRRYWKFGSQQFSEEQKARTFEAIARNYLRVGNLGAALGRLQRGASQSGETLLSAPLLLRDGKPLMGPDKKPARTMRDAATALEQFVDNQSNEALPDVGLPVAVWLNMTLDERYELEKKIKKKEWSYPQPFEAQDQAHTLPGVDRMVQAPVDLPQFERHDRLLAWANRKLVCIAPGEAKSLWSSDALPDGADACAWVDHARVLVWGEGNVALLDEKGASKWSVDIRSLPAVEMLSNDSSEAPPVQEQVPVQPQVRIIRRGRFGAMGIAPMPMPQVVAPPQPNAPADGKERVEEVRPLEDRLIVSTTSGRVAALDLNDGHLLWQTRVANSAGIQQTVATDDFTALRVYEGSVVRLIALDSFTGQQVFRTVSATSSSNCPVNCVLSPDGTLVWTTATSMLAKDLYEPGDQITWETRTSGHRYNGFNRPDQLVVYGQQVFAVCDDGQRVDRRMLASGTPRGNWLQAARIGTATDVTLRIAGQRLYVVTPQSMFSYFLGQDTSVPMPDEQQVQNLPGDVMLTKDVVLLPRVSMNIPDGTHYSLAAFSRKLIHNPDDDRVSESGSQCYRIDLQEPSKIKDWAAVEGGVYYLSGDGKLHWLKGARK